MPLESSGTEAFVCLFVCMCVCLQKAAYYREFNPEAVGAAQGQTDQHDLSHCRAKIPILLF